MNPTSFDPKICVIILELTLHIFDSWISTQSDRISIITSLILRLFKGLFIPCTFQEIIFIAA